jgi:hypothetical protein
MWRLRLAIVTILWQSQLWIFRGPNTLYVGISQQNFQTNEQHKLDKLKYRFPV